MIVVHYSCCHDRSICNRSESIQKWCDLNNLSGPYCENACIVTNATLICVAIHFTSVVTVVGRLVRHFVPRSITYGFDLGNCATTIWSARLQSVRFGSFRFVSSSFLSGFGSSFLELLEFPFLLPNGTADLSFVHLGVPFVILFQAVVLIS